MGDWDPFAEPELAVEVPGAEGPLNIDGTEDPLNPWDDHTFVALALQAQAEHEAEMEAQKTAAQEVAELAEADAKLAAEKEEEFVREAEAAVEQAAREATAIAIREAEFLAAEKDVGSFHGAARSSVFREIVRRRAARARIVSLSDIRETCHEVGTRPVALLFPDHTSVQLNMLCRVRTLPSVATMLNRARKILGYDIVDLCTFGPLERLQEPRFAQPVAYIAGLSFVEKLKSETPSVFDGLRAVAGLSLGEYAALTVAGVFDFEVGLKLVKVRAEAMHEAAQTSPQSTLAISGIDGMRLAAMCLAVKSELDGTNEGSVCQVTHSLFDGGYAVGGTALAVDVLRRKLQNFDRCEVNAANTGAFHTPLMEMARMRLLDALREAEPLMRSPQVDVYMNLTGKRISTETKPAEIVWLLLNQVTNCVLWERCIQAMIVDGVQQFYECGPKPELKLFMQHIRGGLVFEATETVGA